MFVFILIHNSYIQFVLLIYMIKLLQLECISHCTGFSLQAAAILLIDKIHENTFVMANGIFYNLLIESTTNLILVGRIHIKMTSKELDGRRKLVNENDCPEYSILTLLFNTGPRMRKL